MAQMLVRSLLIGCLADPAGAGSGDFSRAAAIELHGARRYVEAGDHMAMVYHAAKTPNERRAAATFVVGAYRDAFTAAVDKEAAAEYLCRGLAISDAFLAEVHDERAQQRGGAPTDAAVARLMTARAGLAQLREPFGTCEQAGAEALLRVSAKPPAPRSSPPPPPSESFEPSPPATRPTISESPRPARPTGRVMTWTGVGVTILGAGTVAVGLGLGLTRAAAAAAGADALTAGAPGRGFTDVERHELQGLRGELSDAKVAMGVGVGAGAALLATGAVLTAVGLKRREPGRAALVPWRRGVAFALRF